MKNINGLQVLEERDFRRFCPSFYATAPKEGVSDRYAFINTRDIAVSLWRAGWYPVFAREARAVDVANRGKTRHMVRWAHKDFRVNGERVELVGINSHNTSAAFKFFCGIFRLICLNGLIAQTGDFGSFSIKHIGDIQGQVMEAVGQISQVGSKVAGRMEAMKAIEMSPDEQGVFARTAAQYLYPNAETERDMPINPMQLIRPRRETDSADPGNYRRHYAIGSLPKGDLWTTFNVVQENVMKGGLRTYNPHAKKRKRGKTRRIHSIEKDVKLNTALWSMAEEMAKLKAA